MCIRDSTKIVKIVLGFDDFSLSNLKIYGYKKITKNIIKNANKVLTYKKK